jgi:gamma-glutamylcyclotransferase (GGCT)/AIG2-like uncharacterized protein YtfP
MNEPVLLFVYGQLRRGHLGWRRLRLASRVEWLGKARIHGRLYHLGDYPALIVGRRGIVHGELLAFRDAALWRALDRYERFDPERLITSEYRRVEVDLLKSGRRAWAYAYNRPIGDRRIIADGTWRAP